MPDKRKRHPHDAPVETEGMGGAGGGDLDDFDAIDDIRDISREARDEIRGDTGVVTGITTGVDTDDATEGPGSPWENLDDGLRESIERQTDTPAS